MKLLNSKLVPGLLAVALALTVGPARAAAGHILELRVIGEGAVMPGESSCWDLGLAPDCTITATGEITEMTGTIVGEGAFRLELRAGPGPVQPNADGGGCLLANRSASAPLAPREQIVALTADDGSTLFLSTVGLFCEEGGPATSYHYNGMYRVRDSGSTGRFANAVGGGSFAVTVWRVGSGTVSLQLHGTIRY